MKMINPSLLSMILTTRYYNKMLNYLQGKNARFGSQMQVKEADKLISELDLIRKKYKGEIIDDALRYRLDRDVEECVENWKEKLNQRIPDAKRKQYSVAVEIKKDTVIIEFNSQLLALTMGRDDLVIFSMTPSSTEFNTWVSQYTHSQMKAMKG